MANVASVAAGGNISGLAAAAEQTCEHPDEPVQRLLSGLVEFHQMFDRFLPDGGANCSPGAGGSVCSAPTPHTPHTQLTHTSISSDLTLVQITD